MMCIMNNSKGFASIIALVMLVVVVAGGAYVFKTYRETREISTTERFESGYKDEDLELNISGDAVSTVNCGDENCFQEKFASCQPASVNLDVGFVAFNYKIIGPKSGGCEVTMKYPKNPNPEWVNKEMTCVFDNKLPFTKASEKGLQAVFDGSLVCSGPLYPLLSS